MNEIDYIVDLLKSYLKDKEKTSCDEEFLALLVKYPFLKELLHDLESQEDIKVAVQHFYSFSEEKSKAIEQRLLSTILDEVRLPDVTNTSKVRRIWLYALTACVLLFVFFGVLWKMNVVGDLPDNVSSELVASFSPGGNRAVLQLADGQIIELSSRGEGLIVGENLSYSDGTLLADDLFEGGVVPQLVLSTPKGGQYQVVLSDGTKVWLNADSKLTYPARFSDKVRYVEVQGEAYFEVAKSNGKPFIVQTANEKVEVLGTHFNVNGYTNELYSTVSLIEGSVKVVLNNNEAVVIKPGQQSIVAGMNMRVQQVNVEDVLAWKNGEFMFDDENLESVARKLGRWYDLDIEVSAELKNISIWGSVSRYDNFNKVLDIIKMTDKNIQLEVKGRRVKFMK